MDGWRKSSYSGGNGGSCVEVAADGVILVRDTTNRDGVMLTFAAEAWETFTGTLR
jgi:phosphoenolpyruvate synthase/pyruvate phosphate dikinase